MKNKLKRIMLSVLCAVCFQAPVTAYAIDLPFVPVQESETTSVTVDESSTEQSSITSDTTSSDYSKPTVSSTITPEKSETEENSTISKKQKRKKNHQLLKTPILHRILIQVMIIL